MIKYLIFFFISLQITSDVIHYHYHGVNPEDFPNHDGFWSWVKTKFANGKKKSSCNWKCRRENCATGGKADIWCNKDETPAYDLCYENCLKQ